MVHENCENIFKKLIEAPIAATNSNTISTDFLPSKPMQYLNINSTKINTINNKDKSINNNTSSPSVNITINFFNAISMFNKRHLISQYLNSNKTDLLFLTESWLSEKILDSMICPTGYDIIRNDRQDTKGGGVCLLYKTGLKVQQVHLNDNLFAMSKSIFEYVCVDLFSFKTKIRLCCVYIRPSFSHCNTKLQTTDL